MYDINSCKEAGIKPDNKYINRKNKVFGYAYTPDSVVYEIKNKIKQWGNKPGKYDYNHAVMLCNELKTKKNMHPSMQEQFIIILQEIDSNNLTGFKQIAENILN